MEQSGKPIPICVIRVSHPIEYRSLKAAYNQGTGPDITREELATINRKHRKNRFEGSVIIFSDGTLTQCFGDFRQYSYGRLTRVFHWKTVRPQRLCNPVSV